MPTSQCGLAHRSSKPAKAGHFVIVAFVSCILCHQAKSTCLRGQLNSNVSDPAGFEVHLVNARHVRNVPGRKSDVLDCQLLQQLMSYGLLRGGFRPAEDVCALRAVWRHRDMLLSYQARHHPRHRRRRA